ncbi:MAG TPA: TetR/AcrR family transcriptional regulator [Solirubrobacteraceae bacterium]|nr:TetR/AcrR family transcriptional regulator [Solirubrobacteraceae bacterium]
MSVSSKTATPAKLPVRRLSAEQRREALLDAAARVFATHGYHAASIAQIAEQAGITKPVIYHHFPSKQQLHRAVFEHYAALLLATAASLGQYGTPQERLRDLVRGMFAFAHEHPYVWQLLLGDSNDPETAQLQQQLRAAGTQQSAQRLLATATFGAGPRLSRTKAAEATAELVRCAVDGLITWSLRHPRVPHMALADAATELIWNGLAQASAPPARSA